MRIVNRIMVLVLASFSLVACSNASSKSELATNNKVSQTTEQKKNTGNVGGIGIVAKAAFRNYAKYKGEADEYEKENQETAQEQTQVASSSADGYYEKEDGIVYLFDEIVIGDSESFKIVIPEDYNEHGYGKLIEVCGTGELTIMYGKCYLYRDGSEMIFDEDYIAVRGELGAYSMLCNTGTELGKLYSSHKTISSEGIDKTFQPPYYGMTAGNSYGKSEKYAFNFATNETSLLTKSDFDINYQIEMEENSNEIIPQSERYKVSDFKF